MSFRIRKPHIEAPDKYRLAQDRYYTHLGSFPKGPDTDLWRYFAWDFFHDGKIKSIKFNPNLSIVKMTISGCNILTYDSTGDYQYEDPLDFVCTFVDVLKFSIDLGSNLDRLSLKKRRPTYLYSEINTSGPKSLVGPKSDCSSLLIKALGQEDLVWINLVFRELSVRPKDLALFNRLKSNPETEFPLFSPHA